MIGSIFDLFSSVLSSAIIRKMFRVFSRCLLQILAVLYILCVSREVNIHIVSILVVIVCRNIDTNFTLSTLIPILRRGWLRGLCTSWASLSLFLLPNCNFIFFSRAKLYMVGMTYWAISTTCSKTLLKKLWVQVFVYVI